MIQRILFWLPLILILHTYAAYPLLLLIINRFSRNGKTIKEYPDQPYVSVLMAVHNEELVIEHKLESLFMSDYPAGKLEVLVGSDASDDMTDRILEEACKKHDSLKVTTYGNRTGKPAVINDLSEKARGEILVITDANVIPEPSTIRLLVRNFSDETVGLVDSRLTSSNPRKDGIALPENAYLNIETMMKNTEGRIWGTMMGPFGGFYAVRKQSYQPNKNEILADDFRICMNVIKKGEKAISDPEAVVFEDLPNNISDEFRRKVRISAGNFQNLRYFSSLLLRPFSKWSFSFISHKVLRWLTPVFWLILVVFNIMLLNTSIFYFLFFLLQVIFIILPPLDILLKKTGINLVPLRFFTHLFMMNVALFTGLIKNLGGIRSGVWTPTKRFQ
ncbi:MAG TPA: glycosyltransferase [Bacteroidales bacterium]|nr:glycosyltransferase [Bacteroidales bacterium]